MNITIAGTINEISDFNGFLTSVVDISNASNINLQNANAATFQPARNIRVHLASVVSAGGFFPTLSLRDTTGNNGRFSFTFDDSVFPRTMELFLLAFQERERITVSPGFTIPIFQPIYRSDAFRISNLQANNQLRLFFDNLADGGFPLPRIAQADVNAQIGAINISGMTSLSARIRNGDVRVRGRGAQGAEVTFEIRIKPSTSNNLGRLIRHEIEEFDLDVPFPANLCVNTDEIRDTVEDNVRDMVRDLNTTIMAGLNGSIPNFPGFDEQTFFAQNATITCADVDFPLTGQQNVNVGNITVPVEVRAIDLEVYLGFPRRIV